ncbi:MAG TPA: GNAT family N-acetyltransferase [Chitinophagaceae bacterium]|nr:GNAT family N-acetyltransferase [Chitinophagaceae bacterium]
MLQLNFSPFPVIQTPRLFLRQMTKSDAPEILFLRSSNEVMRYIGREKSKTIADAEDYLDKIAASINSNNGIMWAITFTGSPEKLIGYIGYWRIVPEHYRAEVGYMLHPDFWRQGIMKEALTALSAYAFNKMGLHSIEATINPGNEASARLLESLGFVKEAYFKEDYYFNGAFHDTIIYSLLQRNLIHG